MRLLQKMEDIFMNAKLKFKTRKKEKEMKKNLIVTVISCLITICLTGCDLKDTSSQKDASQTIEVANLLAENQPTPTDIDYSLERYNLTRRAYWVNGQREKSYQSSL